MGGAGHRVLERAPGLGRMDEVGAESGMPRKRDLPLPRKDPEAELRSGKRGRKEERGRRVVHLARHELQGGVVHP